jgi:hypothetical protein
MSVNRLLAATLLVLVIAFSGCVSSVTEKDYVNDTKLNGAAVVSQICPRINDSDLNNYCLAMAGKEESYCAEIRDSSKKDLCYGFMMKSLGKEEFCAKMESTQSRDFCYAQIGSLKGSIELCGKVTDQSASYRDLCYSAAANVTHSADTCLKASSNETIERCYLFLAGAWNDSSICDRINYAARKYECIITTGSCSKISDSAQAEKCGQYQALRKFNVEKCESISLASGISAGDSCYWEEATARKDPMLCAKISSQEESNLCLAVTQNNLSLCCQSKGICSDYCYRGFAAYNNDSSVCSYVNDSADKVWCLAVTKRDSSICDVYQNIWVVDKDVPWSSELALDEFCKGDGSGNYSNLCYCRTIGKNTPECYSAAWWLVNDCYQNIAIFKKDPRICDNLVEWARPEGNNTAAYNSTNSYNCKSSVVASVSDISICSKPEFSALKESCTHWVALSQNQSALCSSLSSDKSRDNCFAILASKLNDETLCSEIKTGEIKNNCLTDIATRLKNLSYCQEIDSVQARDLCYAFVAENLV